MNDLNYDITSLLSTIKHGDGEMPLTVDELERLLRRVRFELERSSLLHHPSRLSWTEDFTEDGPMGRLLLEVGCWSMDDKKDLIAWLNGIDDAY